jgi:ubiquinone/menaquinone biosynthesis C-methylase UbiE
MNSGNTLKTDTEGIKQCCARLYESDVARLLLGESFHPGGLRLTERLGILLGLNAQSRVLDVASGKGASAIFLAERFGCEVEGIDYSAQNVEQAAAVVGKTLTGRVRFRTADAERLPFDDGSFDAVICECAFCTFPDKASAAREFARVLRHGGSVGLSDLTRGPDLPQELGGLLAWVACIADAQPPERYKAYLTDAGLCIDAEEAHDDALTQMVQQVRLKLLSVEIATGLKKLQLPDFDLTAAKGMAAAAIEAVKQGKLGYSIICGAKV